MGRSVTLRTRVPTLDEVGESLGLSKARQRSVLSIVSRDSTSGFFVEKRRQSAPGAKRTARVKKESSAASR
jgi:hypothetical protein